MNTLRRKKKLGSRFSNILRHQKSNLKTDVQLTSGIFETNSRYWFSFFKAFGFLSRGHFGKIILSKSYFGQYYYYYYYYY